MNIGAREEKKIAIFAVGSGAIKVLEHWWKSNQTEKLTYTTIGCDEKQVLHSKAHHKIRMLPTRSMHFSPEQVAQIKKIMVSCDCILIVASTGQGFGKTMVGSLSKMVGELQKLGFAILAEPLLLEGKRSRLFFQSNLEKSAACLDVILEIQSQKLFGQQPKNQTLHGFHQILNANILEKTSVLLQFLQRTTYSANSLKSLLGASGFAFFGRGVGTGVVATTDLAFQELLCSDFKESGLMLVVIRCCSDKLYKRCRDWMRLKVGAQTKFESIFIHDESMGSTIDLSLIATQLTFHPPQRVKLRRNNSVVAGGSRHHGRGRVYVLGERRPKLWRLNQKKPIVDSKKEADVTEETTAHQQPE